MSDTIDYKAKFIEILSDTRRKGVEDVIKGLEKLGFFEAPASSKHHLAEKGGLVKHSLNVYSQALAIRDAEFILHPELQENESLSKDSIAIVALLHDVCKAEIYKTVEKFRKDKNNQWEKYNTYDANYTHCPLGHGEKSVIRLLRMGLELKDEEILAIRWHMGAWDLTDSYEQKGNFGAACDRSPLVSILIAADELATRISENL